MIKGFTLFYIMLETIRSHICSRPKNVVIMISDKLLYTKTILLATEQKIIVQVTFRRV